MAAMIIDGKKIASEIRSEIKEDIIRLGKWGHTVSLAVILVGDDPASQVYVRNKKNACSEAGIISMPYELPESTTQEELLGLIETLNNDSKCNGILVQLPLPKHIDTGMVINAIDPKKDVDGFHPYNVGRLSTGLEGPVSCTPYGIIEMLKRSGIEMDGRHAVVVGRSNIVGKPMAMLLLRENCTVTVAHSHTKDLAALCRTADILVAAIGKAKYITGEYIKEGAAVIDVGMNRDENNKLCGDVDFDDVIGKASAITPVPGGVGPMTITMLLYNCVKAVRDDIDEM